MTRNNIKPEIVILSLRHNDHEGTAIDTPMLGEIRRACFKRRSEGSSNRNIDAMVCRLRKHIAEKSLYFPLITAYGTGYQFTGTCTFCSA